MVISPKIKLKIIDDLLIKARVEYSNITKERKDNKIVIQNYTFSNFTKITYIFLKKYIQIIIS